ncbi:MAG: hypothetical protein JWM11_34 [Planctomycetaceae bacterium]|nr:hypothetical protein [Planctomycetaceae bacterium]
MCRKLLFHHILRKAANKIAQQELRPPDSSPSSGPCFLIPLYLGPAILDVASSYISALILQKAQMIRIENEPVLFVLG